MSIANKLETDFRPVVEELGYELVYVEFVKEGQEWYLRFFIDHTDGIGLDDCEKVSKSIEPLLDEQETLKGQYILEVSSLGLERPLRNDEDYRKAIGQLIAIGLYRAVDKKKQLRGILLEYGDSLIIEVQGISLEIEKDNISKANLSIDI